MNINQIQEFTEEYIVDSTPKACFQIYDWPWYSEPFSDWLAGGTNRYQFENAPKGSKVKSEEGYYDSRRQGFHWSEPR